MFAVCDKQTGCQDGDIHAGFHWSDPFYDGEKEPWTRTPIYLHRFLYSHCALPCNMTTCSSEAGLWHGGVIFVPLETGKHAGHVAEGRICREEELMSICQCLLNFGWELFVQRARHGPARDLAMCCKNLWVCCSVWKTTHLILLGLWKHKLWC